MTQELVDKIEARVKARRNEIDQSLDRVKASTEKLIKVGFLKRDGEISDKYKDGVVSVNEFLETYLPSHTHLNLEGLKPALQTVGSKPETLIQRFKGFRKSIVH